MADLDWNQFLGWSKDQMNELRFAGFSFLRQGKYDKALSFFNALVIIDSNHYDLQTLGAIHLQTGNAQDAIHWLDQAISLEPNNEISLLNKAKALFMVHKKQEALLVARKLIPSHNRTIASDAQALIIAYS